MGRRLQNEVKQNKRFRSVEAEAFLNILRTADALTRDVEKMLRSRGLTFTQYNLLRILRGAGKSGATCSEISERMIKKDPDVTRLLDRMEKRGLITRSRDKRDRRVVTTTITLEGLNTVEKLDGPVDELHARQLRGLSKQRLRQLIDDMEGICNKGG